MPLGEITVGRLREWQASLLAAGVSAGTIQKARAFLSGVLRHAAEAEMITANPLGLVRPPRGEPKDLVRPLAPATIEAIRRALLDPPPRSVAPSAPGQRNRRGYPLPARDRQERRRDAMIVSVLAYAGLRPGELRALRWGDVRERTLLIERAADPTETPNAPRPVGRAASGCWLLWPPSCGSGGSPPGGRRPSRS